MAAMDKSFSFSFGEQTLLLNALTMYIKSCERASRAAVHPDIKAVQQRTAEEVAVLRVKVAK